jgi:hypothetical protein
VQHDVRRAQHVAARIEQHVGGAPFGRGQDLLQRLRGKLHAGEQSHGLRHVAEAAGGAGRADFTRARGLDRLHLGDGHPLADVDALGAGVGAARAAVAGAEPLLQGLRRRLAARQGQKLADAFLGGAGIEADLARRRAGFEAFTTGRAAIGCFGDQGFQTLGIGTQGGPPGGR